LEKKTFNSYLYNFFSFKETKEANIKACSPMKKKIKSRTRLSEEPTVTSRERQKISAMPFPTI